MNWDIITFLESYIEWYDSPNPTDVELPTKEEAKEMLKHYQYIIDEEERADQEIAYSKSLNQL